jgi:hypothetical protein
VRSTALMCTKTSLPPSSGNPKPFWALNHFTVPVSTAEQTLGHQLTQARQAGHQIDDEHVVADHGVSGVATKLCERPEGRRLFDMLRKGDTLVVRWGSRNYDDVVETIQRFMKRGVVIKTVINGFTFDGSTTDPIQKAVRDSLISFMAATAQAQAEATKDAQRAGIARQGHRSESVPQAQAVVLTRSISTGHSPGQSRHDERKPDRKGSPVAAHGGRPDQGRSGSGRSDASNVGAVVAPRLLAIGVGGR